MVIARSRLTAQGQISVPVEVRRRLGVAPGSVLEWHAEGDAVVVRRSARYSSADIHHVLFGKGRVRRRTVEDFDEGIRGRMRERHARR